MGFFENVDVCVYHKNCDDGFCCALIIWRLLSNRDQNVEYLPMNYSTDVNDNLQQFSGKNVLIVDLSFPKNDLLAIKNVAKSILVVDHHKTAEEQLKDLSFSVFDMNESGVSLLYKLILDEMKDKLPDNFHDLKNIVEYTKDRDLWNFDLEDSNEINAYIKTLPKEFKIYNKVANDLNNKDAREKIVRLGKSILDTMNRMAKEFSKNSVLVDLLVSPDGDATVKARVVNCSLGELISLSGHTILHEHDVSVAVLYSIFPNGNVVYSVRSSPSFDSSRIANAWGGGGHKSACGFRGTLKDGFPWTLSD